MKNSGQGKYGLRFEDMDESELELYREFWQEPAPDPQYLVTDSSVARARSRMLTGLSFTGLILGILLALVPMMLGHLWLSLPGFLLCLIAAAMVIMTRRRYFSWLRPDGQAPLARPKSRWFWLPHSLAFLGLLAAVIGSTIIPSLYANFELNDRRNHILAWHEAGMTLVLMAALAYGLIALKIYTPEDQDESIIRPTDYAEKQLEKDLAAGRRDDDFYDSSWLSGR